MKNHNNGSSGRVSFSPQPQDNKNITTPNFLVTKTQRAVMKNQKPKVIWLMGLSGAGKTTIANVLEQKLHLLGRHTYILDGDNLRTSINKDLGFSEQDRVENIRRTTEIAKLMADAGLIVIVALITPFERERTSIKKQFLVGECLQVFVDTSLEICKIRDPKGLYKKAIAGEIKNFTGINSKFEVPTFPDVIIQTIKTSADRAADQIIKFLQL